MHPDVWCGPGAGERGGSTEVGPDDNGRHRDRNPGTLSGVNSSQLKRRTPLKRNGTLSRSAPTRRTPLKARSAKRQTQATQEAAFKRALMASRGEVCEAAPLTPTDCGSPFLDRPRLEKHERRSRGRGGDPLDETNCVLVCQSCHDWITGNVPEAERVGLLLKTGE